jgi:DNA-binding winged helix-turn-helix (wHTH) protein/TolB-like protein
VHQQQTVRIGCVLYDRSRSELRRADDGSTAQIRPQSMRVLDLLVDNAGKLVTRDAIHSAVWPGVVVTDDSLVQCITEIRRAVGDTRHEIVRTVPRRGYRLEVVEEDHRPGTHSPAVVRPPPRRRLGRWLVMGAVAAVALAVSVTLWRRGAPAAADETLAAPDVVRPALAVMAFRADRADPDMQALGQGWAEDLAASLARDVDLRLVSTRSSFAVSPASGPVAVARQLGVRYLVDGWIRHQDHELQLTAQLIDGHDGTIVWTQRLELTGDNFDIQRDELIRRAAASVQASMRLREKEVARRTPRSMDAHILTLRAYGNKHRYTADAYRAARADLEDALRLEPEFAAAWAGLGYLNGIDAINHITGSWTLDQLPRALDQIDRALALDPALSIAFQARAVVLGAMRRQAEALAAAEEAVRIAPGDPDNILFLSKSLVEAGRVDEGLTTLRRALPLYPIEPVYVSFVAAHVFWAAGLHSDAASAGRRCVELAPAFTNCRVTLASALVELGQLEEGQVQAERIRALMPNATSLAFTNLFDGVPELRQRRLRIADALHFPRAQ